MQDTWVQSLGQEYPLEEERATLTSILAWKIPWTEKPSRLQSMGSQRVGPNLVKEKQTKTTALHPWLQFQTFQSPAQILFPLVSYLSNSSVSSDCSPFLYELFITQFKQHDLLLYISAFYLLLSWTSRCLNHLVKHQFSLNKILCPFYTCTLVVVHDRREIFNHCIG